jgi:hypothetical protein
MHLLSQRVGASQNCRLQSQGVFMKPISCRCRRGSAWLELLFAIAVLILIFQVFPGSFDTLVWILNFSNWPRTAWFAINWVILIILASVRFLPGMYRDFKLRQNRKAADHERKEKEKELRKQRETLERLKRGRERRIY